MLCLAGVCPAGSERAMSGSSAQRLIAVLRCASALRVRTRALAIAGGCSAAGEVPAK